MPSPNGSFSLSKTLIKELRKAFQSIQFGAFKLVKPPLHSAE